MQFSTPSRTREAKTSAKRYLLSLLGIRRAGVGSLAAALLGFAGSWSGAWAADYTWNNPTNGNWNAPGSWAPGGGPPNAADNATISVAGTYAVTVDDDQAINNLTINNSTATLSHTAGTLTVGGTIDLTAGTYSLNGGTISGGAITSGGGILQLLGSGNNTLNNVSVGLGVLDFSANFAQVRLQGTTSLAAGTTLDLNGFNAGVRFEQTTTLNDLTVNLSNASSSFLSVEGSNTLTLGGTTTVTATGNGNASLTSDGTGILRNQGLIQNTGPGFLFINPSSFANLLDGIVRAQSGDIQIGSGGVINQAGGLFDVNGGRLTLAGTDWSNLGTINVSNGTLNLGGSFTTAGIGAINRTGGDVQISGALDNSAATLALNAATGSYQLNGGTISGGAITSGGGILQLLGSGNNTLNNVSVGLGVLDFSANFAQVRLQGTTSLAAGTTLELNGFNAGVRFEQTTTLNDLTVNLSNASSSFLSVEGSNTLTLGGTTTVTATGNGNASLTSDGTGILRNQGLIQNTGPGFLFINPSSFANLLDGIVRAQSGDIQIGSGGVINQAGGLFDVNGGRLTLAGTDWSNLGTINVSNGTLNLGGSFTTAGIGAINRTGGDVQISGALDNSAATLALNAATGSYQLNGGTISGGAIISGGGILQLLGSGNNTLNNVSVGLGVLDFSANFAQVRLQGTTSLAAGTTLELNGFNAGVRFEQTTTLNDLTVNLSNASSSFLSVEGSNTLTLGGTTTVTATGNGNASLTSDGTGILRNQGLIQNTGPGFLFINPSSFANLLDGIVRAQSGDIQIGSGGVINQAGGLFDVNGGRLTLAGTDWSNLGTINVSNGTLNLGGSFTTAGIGAINRTGGDVQISGALDNSAATLALNAATGSYQLFGGTITGGNITASGGNTLQLQGFSSNTLSNVSVGVGVLDFSANFAQVRLQGTTSLAAGTTLELNGFNAGVRFEQTTTLNDLTVNLSNASSSFLSVEGSNTLTLGGTTTVTATGNGNASLTSDGTGILRNQGLIQNTGPGFLFINPSVFSNLSGGTIRAQDGFVSIPDATNLTNFAGNTLTGGTWEIHGSATLDLGTRNVSTLAAGTTVLFNGANPTFTALNALTTNNGTLRVLGGKTFTPTAATVANSGTIQVGAGSAFGKGIIVANGGVLTGSGTVQGAVLVQSGGMVAPGDSPGTLTIENTVAFQSGSIFRVELNGTTPGFSYDQLVVGTSGALDLGSATLTTLFGGGYVPEPGHLLFIIDNRSSSPTIGTFNGLPQDARVSLGAYFGRVSYVGNAISGMLTGGNDVVLYGFDPTPEPAHVLFWCAAGCGFLGLVRRRLLNRPSSSTTGLLDVSPAS